MLDTVGVVGLGLIGGSIAKALRPHVSRLIGVDPRVRARGLIDAAGPISACDLVIVSVPLASTPRVLAQIASQMNPGATLMDTAGVKGKVFEAAARLKRPVNFISGHPMAGTEHKGFEHSDASLFRGRPFLLIPGLISGNRPIRIAEELVRRLGSRPVWLLNAAHHDLALAYVSQAPHLAAYALLTAAAAPLSKEYRKNFLMELAGPSFRDATRVAQSPPESAASYIMSNRKNALRALKDLERALAEWGKIIKRGDKREIKSRLQGLIRPSRSL